MNTINSNTSKYPDHTGWNNESIISYHKNEVTKKLQTLGLSVEEIDKLDKDFYKGWSEQKQADFHHDGVTLHNLLDSVKDDPLSSTIVLAENQSKDPVEKNGSKVNPPILNQNVDKVNSAFEKALLKKEISDKNT